MSDTPPEAFAPQRISPPATVPLAPPDYGTGPIAERLARQRQQMHDAIRQAAANYVYPRGIDLTTPDYTTGRNANPEDYVPYDPITGRPRYLEPSDE